MSWLFRLFRRSEAEAQLDDEIRFHLEQEAQLRQQRGEAPDAAARAARRDFGNVGLVKEVTREAWGWVLVEDLARDLRQAVRMLGRSPVFTAVAIGSLALGIGANTAIFSLADAVIFRELPVRDPKGLYQVRAVHQRGVETIYSYPRYREIRDRNRVFSATVAASSWAIPEPVEIDRRELRPRITAVSGNYFETLGVQPAFGRLFTPADDRVPGAHPVAVIGYRFWRQALDSTPAVTSAHFLHNGVTYQILGVAAPGFTGVSSNDDPDIWVPTMMINSVLRRGDHIRNPNVSSLIVFGRLKPGVTAAEASAGVAAVYREMQPTEKDLDGKRGEAVSMARGVQSLRTNFERPLLVLLGLAGLLLLIACANLAALLTARAMARRHEIAVRKSLGALTLRLLRQFLTESLLIALAGGVAGLMVSSWAASLLVGIVTTSTRRLPIHIAVDMRMLAVATVISGVAALLFGLLPAIQANRIGSSARTPSRLPASRFLCAGQLALSLFLLVVAGLFARSLGNLRGLDTGFVRENVLVLQIDPVVAYGEDNAKYLALYENLVERVEALPGVRSASLSSATFFGGSSSRGNITYEGQGGEAPRSEWPFKVRVTPKFHETLGLSMRGGRAFTDRDDPRAPQVAIVSESVARRNFPGGNAVGKHFCFSGTFAAKCAIEIVGVARDVSYSSLRRDSPYAVYLPIRQSLSQRPDLQVRTWANPALLSAEVQRVIRQYDSNLRVTHSVTLERLVEDSIVQDRLVAILASSFGLLALVLSAVGLYGITAYGVQARSREIGVRIALGATSANVRWLVLREVLVLLGVGVALAVPAAWAGSSIVRGLLFGLTPTDPLAIGGAILALGGTALLAGYLPSRRASRIDPIHALRIE